VNLKHVKIQKLQHTNAFVSYNSENECLFGCKLCRTTCSVREEQVVLRLQQLVRRDTKKGFFRPWEVVVVVVVVYKVTVQ